MAFLGQRFLEANQVGGLANAQRLRSQVLDPEQAAFQQSLAGAQGEFNAASAPVDASGTIAQLNADPTALTGDPAKLAAYQQLRSGQYGGPSTLQDVSSYGDALTQYGQARASLDNAGTQGGREELVGRLGGEGRLRQTAGTRGLDAALIGADAGAQGTLVGAGTTPLEQSLTQADAAAAERAGAARGAATAAAGQLKGAEQSALISQQTDLQGRLTAGQQSAQASAARLQGLLRAGAADPTLAQELGIDQQALAELQAAPGTKTRAELQTDSKRAQSHNPLSRDRYLKAWGMDYNASRPGVASAHQAAVRGDIGQYLTAAGPTSINDVATDADRARAAALQQLSGSAQSTLGPAPSTPTRAVRFDVAGAQRQAAAGLASAKAASVAKRAFNARNGSGSTLLQRANPIRIGQRALGNLGSLASGNFSNLQPLLGK